MSPQPALSRSRGREILVGVFVIFGTLAVIGLLLLVTDPAMLRGRHTVRLVVEDAQGLRRGDPVRLRGVTIGQVDGFELVDGAVAVELELEGGFDIPADSTAAVRSTSLLGEKAVQIIPGESDQLLRAGQAIEGQREAAPEAGLLEQVDDLAVETEGALGRIRELLSANTIENVEQSTEDVNELLDQLQGLTSRAQELAARLNVSAENISSLTSGPELEQSLQNIQGFTEQLSGVLRQVSRGEGSLGQLAQDESLYRNADRAAAWVGHAAMELRTLLRDIRQQPNKYFDISIF